MLMIINTFAAKVKGGDQKIKEVLSLISSNFLSGGQGGEQRMKKAAMQEIVYYFAIIRPDEYAKP